MRICYFGTYEKDCPRNRIVIKGLRKQGIEVIECHYPLWERHTDKTGDYLSSFSLLKITLRLIWGYLFLTAGFARLGNFDYLMVGYIGQADVFLARLLLLFKKRPLIFNPMISIYDTLVLDRKIFRKGTMSSGILFHIDKWSFQHSDIIVLDTIEHINYISELFSIDKKKFVRTFIGADEDLFYPRHKDKNTGPLFHVLFYGKFIPLHGLHHVLYAAKELEGDPEILFKIIGKGQLSEEIHQLAKRLDLKNVEFTDWVTYEKLPDHIAGADVCLGIFGDSGKAIRVIPNKVFQALACGKEVISSDTPAIRELGRVSGLHLCRPGDAGDLSALISRMKNNRDKKTPAWNYGEKISKEMLDPFIEKTMTMKTVGKT